MRAIIIVIFTLIFFSCSGVRNLTLYVTNINETEELIQLKIFIDDSLYVNNDFTYSSITPNYDTYVFKFDKGVHKLKVIKDGSLVLADTFNLRKDMFIYVSYGEGLQGQKGKVFLKKTTTNYKLH